MVCYWIVARSWAVQRTMVVVAVMIVIVSEPGIRITEHEQTYGKYKRLRHRVFSKSKRTQRLVLART